MSPCAFNKNVEDVSLFSIHFFNKVAVGFLATLLLCVTQFCGKHIKVNMRFIYIAH